MDFEKLKQKVREKLDLIVVILIVVSVTLLIVIGMRMQRSYSIRQSPPEQYQLPEKVDLTTKSGEAGGEEDSVRKETFSYLLKPSPGEVLAMIQELGTGDLPASSQKYASLRVMWPVYFFQVMKESEGRATVMLDVSEDGFGATVVTDIDTHRFPEIMTTSRGTKIWVAGEILGIDPTGTGTIHLLTEEVRFQEGLNEAIHQAGNGSGTPPARVPLQKPTTAEEGSH